VATIAEQYSVSRGASKAPISAHPAFPAIVALWFAALLGLGNLVLPTPLLERLVMVTGLAGILPSAAPPLGFTARTTIALAGALAGAVIGLLLARQVARSQAPRPSGRSFAGGEARPRRPISAHDELGEEGLGTDTAGTVSLAPVALKRRSLAMAEENRRSEYLQTVPLPGQEQAGDASLPLALASAGSELPPAPGAASAERQEFVPPADAATDADDALELVAFAEDAGTGADDAPEFDSPGGIEALRRRVHSPADFISPQDQPMTDRQIFQPPATFDEDEGDWQDSPPAGNGRDEQPRATAAPAIPQAFEPAPDAIDPLPFAAPSLRRNGPAEAEASDDADWAATAPRLTVVGTAGPAEEAAGEPSGDRPLEELGLVQLAARLGASIEKRRALRGNRRTVAANPAPTGTPLEAPGEFEAAGAEDAARAIADFFGPAKTPASPADESFESPVAQAAPDDGQAPAMPGSLASLRLDDHEVEDDDEAFAASFALPKQARPAAEAAPAPEPEPELEPKSDDAFDYADEEDGEELDESEFSSLLAMKNPFSRREEFVRIDEPEGEADDIEPTVTFPAAAPAGLAQAGSESGRGTDSRPFDPPKNPAESANHGTAVQPARDTGDAERNLRAALDTLQRMSGTA